MTSIVGVRCRDGVVIGADSSSTFTHTAQLRTIEQPTADKIHIYGGRVIVAGTGEVGLGQRFGAVVEKAVNELGSKFPTAIECGKGLAKAGLEDFKSTGVQGGYGALVAFACKDAPHLCEFPIANFQPELKTDDIWYVSLGGAQLITDPFLGFLRQVFWEDGPPALQDGIFSVVWTLEQAINLNTGGVKDPIRIAILERNPSQTTGHPWIARSLSEEEIEVHSQNVDAARKHLREFRKKHAAEAAADLPAPPAAPVVPPATLPSTGAIQSTPETVR